MNRSHPAVAAQVRLAELRRSDAPLRRAVLAVRAWALADGVAIEPDPLAAVIGTLLAEEQATGLPPALWTESRVLEFVWNACYLWCLEQAIAPPAGVVDALRVWWAYLAGNNSFTPESDPLPVLLVALASCATPPRTPKRGRRAVPGRNAG